MAVYIFVVTEGDGVNPGALDIIATDDFAVLPSVPLGVNPTFAFFDPNLDRLYVTNSGSNTVSVFDASNVNVSAFAAHPAAGHRGSRDQPGLGDRLTQRHPILRGQFRLQQRHRRQRDQLRRS